MVVGCRGTVTLNPRYLMLPEASIRGLAPNNFVVSQQQFVAYAACQTIFELILFILRNAKQVKLAFSKTLRV